MILHANIPDIKAAKKPTIIDSIGIPETAGLKSPPMTLKNVSPSIGTRTIKNENCATASFFTPQSNPVAIVVPERDKPGKTAIAWDNPITKALQ